MSATNVTYGMLIDGSNIYAPTLINNVVKPSSNPNAQVSCNMFKSASLYTSDGKAPFSAYIKGALEPVCGGHYYAKSFNNNTYQKCSCTIPLANCKMTKGYVNNVENKRVGYISIGIATEGGSLYHHFDVGLGNAGDGWYPMVWGQNFLANVTPNGPNIIHRDDADVPIAIALNDSKVIIPATATVSVLVEVGRTASVDWMRATFSYSGKTGKIAINVPRGTLFPNDSATNPTVRFNRFMSLVPVGGYSADVADHSRLEGRMENLQIGSANWTSSNLQHVWDVQDENVPTVQISTLADSGGASNKDHAVIYHTHTVH